MYTHESKERATKLLSISLLNVDQFVIFFSFPSTHCGQFVTSHHTLDALLSYLVVCFDIVMLSLVEVF